MINEIMFHKIYSGLLSLQLTADCSNSKGSRPIPRSVFHPRWARRNRLLQLEEMVSRDPAKE